MSTAVKIVSDEASTELVEGNNGLTRVVSGHEYSCACDSRKALGLIALVVAAVALIFAAILAAGVFGGGKMGIIAGGLTVGSMVVFALAAVLLIPKKDNMFDK